MNHRAYYPPHLTLVLHQRNGSITGIAGAEKRMRIDDCVAFHCKFTFKHGDQDMPRTWLDGTVDHQKVTVMNAESLHAVAGHLDEKSRRWALHQRSEERRV